jgi:regulatory subunit for Cdc7p protein kinase
MFMIPCNPEPLLTFAQHIQSRKHRKFAMTQDNWTELDALLVQLKRPHKEH